MWQVGLFEVQGAGWHVTRVAFVYRLEQNLAKFGHVLYLAEPWVYNIGVGCLYVIGGV